jgi:ubiquinone/menaquinone biosynthesis C-methylase UbiE
MSELPMNEIQENSFRKVSVDEAYSSEPWWYDVRGFLILTFAYRSTLPAQIRLFGNNIGKRHLEVAIGSGTLFDLILKAKRLKGKRLENQIVGFDYAPSMLAGAKKRFKKHRNIELHQADAADLPYDSASFDTVNIANAIHCLPDIESSLQEMYRVLKPGGTLAGNCLLYPKGTTLLDRISNRINNWGIKRGILHRPYMAQEMKAMLRKHGFQIKYERIVGNCYDFVAVK